jgi:hypothetical protein
MPHLNFMTKQEVIEKLRVLTGRIDNLADGEILGEEFQRWQHDVRVLLKHAFKNESAYEREFSSIAYSLPSLLQILRKVHFELRFALG